MTRRDALRYTRRLCQYLPQAMADELLARAADHAVDDGCEAEIVAESAKSAMNQMWIAQFAAMPSGYWVWRPVYDALPDSVDGRWGWPDVDEWRLGQV